MRLRTLCCVFLAAIALIPERTFIQNAEGQRLAEGAFMIDMAVPGTQVFYRAMLLGEVPYEMTEERLAELGFSGQLDMDGWAEGLFFGKEGEYEQRIMYRVPDSEAEKYVEIETPWGRRTKLQGGSGEYGISMKANPRPVSNSAGLALEIEAQSRVKLQQPGISVKLVLRNVGDQEIVGFAPSLVLMWGTHDTPWRLRNSMEVRLDSKWESVSPGEVLEEVVVMPTPNVAEDYSLFGLFNLFETDRADSELVSPGSVYSNSEYVAVR